MPESTNNVDSKFRFILLAAKRARQLQGGARPLVHTTAGKSTRIAQEELRSGMLQFEILPPPDSEAAQKEQATPKKSKK